jgi:hypothetical protein
MSEAAGSGTIIRIALAFLRAVRQRGLLADVGAAGAPGRYVGGRLLDPGDIAPEESHVTHDADGNPVTVLPEITVYGTVHSDAGVPSRAGVHFHSPDEAAAAALKEIYARTMDEDHEFAGKIYRNSDGSYSFSPPVTIGSDRESDANLSPTPPGAPIVATYHSHGVGHLPTDELFSPDDKLKATLGHKASYVLTPSGGLFKYRPIDLLPIDEQARYPTGRVTRL